LCKRFGRLRNVNVNISGKFHYFKDWPENSTDLFPKILVTESLSRSLCCVKFRVEGFFCKERVRFSDPLD